MQRLRQRHPRQDLSFVLGFLLIFPWPAAAQKQNPPATQPQTVAAPPQAAPPAPLAAEDGEEETSFDQLLAADSYHVYAEARLIGQQMSAGQAAGEIVRAAERLQFSSKELKALTAFLTAHAEQLTDSRLMAALMPASQRPGVPQALIAVDFANAADAQRFESSVRRFVGTLKALTALPDKAAANTPAPIAKRRRRGAAVTVSPTPQVAAPPPLHLVRKANVLLLSDVAIDVRALKPVESAPLATDPHFQTLRARFAAEQFFVHVATGPIMRNWRRNMEIVAQQQRELEQAEGAADRPPVIAREAEPDATIVEPDAPAVAATTEDPATATPETQVPPPAAATPNEPASATSPSDGAVFAEGDVISQRESELSASRTAMGDAMLSVLPLMLFGGYQNTAQLNWPEAVGVGLQAEGDELALRVLLAHGTNGNASPIPMLDFVKFGPALSMGAPAHAPENTDLLIGASLDLPATLGALFDMRAFVTTRAGDESPTPPSVDLETKYGFKKDDLTAALSGEVAVSVPLSAIFSAPRGAVATTNAGQNGPVFFLAVRDKSRLQQVLPRALEAIGAKNAQEQAMPEVIDDVEITAYQQSATALVGDFLVLGTDARDVGLVVEAYRQRQTLGGKKEFLDATSWAPPQKLGYAFLAETFMRKILRDTQRAAELADETVKNFSADLPQEARPMTYALSDAGAGMLHELRVPKSLVTTAMAASAAESNKTPLARNEDAAVAELRDIYFAQQGYREGEGQGSYGTIEQLVRAKQFSGSPRVVRNGYRLEISVSGEHFQATATPEIYGKTGQRSYFIDETGVVRGGDTGGNRAAATESAIF